METEKFKDELKNEKNVANIADILLKLGLILSVTLIIIGFAQYESSYLGYTTTPVNWYIVAGGITLALYSLCVWGILIMLSNISTTLKNQKQ